jgi:hypothetical protein
VAVDVDGSAPCSSAGLHVSPAIAHHEAATQIEPEIVSGVEEESGSGLTATASVGVVVKTDVDGRYRKLPAQLPVDFVDHLSALLSPRDVRLVCHDNQDESSGL